MVLNADTDGDLRAVHTATEDAQGTPAEPVSEEAAWADFAGVPSHELGRTARRMVEALSHRTDAVAQAELQSLYESLEEPWAVASRAQAVRVDGDH